MAATRLAATSSDGTGYSRAVTGPFEVTRLVFPPSFRHGAVEPERGYLVVVLDGAVSKSFASGPVVLSRGSVATLPAGAPTRATLWLRAQVLAVRAADTRADALFGSLLG